MVIIFLISIFTLYSNSNEAKALSKFKCIDKGSIRYLQNKKYKQKKTSYCVDNLYYKFIAKKCITSKKCLALKRYSNPYINNKDIVSDKSSYSLQCKFLKGKQSFIDYLDNSKWKSANICTFKDGSFISVYNTLEKRAK